MTVFGLYLRDLGHRRTASHGIVNYAVGLARALPAALAPDERLVVFANTEIAPELAPGPGVTVLAERGPARGVRRVLSDHVGALVHAQRSGVDVLHFPKGFVPAVNPTRVRVVATVHDDIPAQYFRGRWGREHRTARNGYFAWAIRHAARSSDAVLTVSEFTRSRLAAVQGGADPVVTGQGVTLPVAPFVPPGRRGAYAVHFGSALPHKQSVAGLRLALAWLSEHRDAGVEEVRVLGTMPHVAGVTDDPRVVRVPPPLPNTAVADLVAHARVVLFCSEYEGFGLPPLEAQALGTPVVHARIPAVVEVLGADAAGGYEPDRPASFAGAMDHALGLDAATLRDTAAAVTARHNWERTAAATMRVYRATAVS